MSTTSPARTRIAPSPTGIAHVGTAWMSLHDWAVARKTGGQFVIRIEDTDRTRFVEGAEAKIYEAFKWLGIEYDEGGEKGGSHEPYHQSERLEIYQEYIQKLLDKGHAYYCFATKEELDAMRAEQVKAGKLPKYDRRWRDADPAEVERRLAAGEPYVIRMKIPDGETIKWNDLIRGDVQFQTDEMDDQVLIKSDGFPTYHFAVVVDDFLMKITHVIRGEEWISSTPKHLLLYRYFGWEAPLYAHMPLIRNPDHSKLSKRKNDVSILSYRDKGYLPEALINFLCLLGWSHPDKKELFSLTEFLDVVTLERVQKSAPVFDVQKLDWMNGVYIRNLPIDELKSRLTPFLPADFPHDRFDQILPLVRERLVTLRDIEAFTSFFYRDIQLDAAELLKKADQALVLEQLTALQQELAKLENWSVESLEKSIRALQENKDWKKSQFFMLVRLVATGQAATPPLFDTLFVLGEKLVQQRISQALQVVTT